MGAAMAYPSLSHLRCRGPRKDEGFLGWVQLPHLREPNCVRFLGNITTLKQSAKTAVIGAGLCARVMLPARSGTGRDADSICTNMPPSVEGGGAQRRKE